MENELGKGKKHAWGKKALAAEYELVRAESVYALLLPYCQHLGTCRHSIDMVELSLGKK